MPKITCVKCNVDYLIKENGVAAIDMAYDPPQPYRVTGADRWECPCCGAQVLAGFANVGVEHFYDNFAGVVAQAFHGPHVIIFERPSDKSRYFGPR